MNRPTKAQTIKRSFTTEPPCAQSYIPEVLKNTACKRHDAHLGMPCFEFLSTDGKNVHIGICNFRAIAAGMNGTISPQSLTSRPQHPRR